VTAKKEGVTLGTITLEDVAPSDLTAVDFLFA